MNGFSSHFWSEGIQFSAPSWSGMTMTMVRSHEGMTGGVKLPMQKVE